MSRRGSAVLLDLDGTLVATRRLYLECYRRALAPHLGRTPADDEILALKPRSEVRLLRSQVGADRSAACLDEFYRHYETLHDRLFQGVYAGVPEMLTALRNTGHPLGIVTGKSRRAWEITRARQPLGEFDVVVLDDDVSAAKPDPEGIRLALDRLDAEAATAFYLGDSIGDVLAARTAGVRPAAATWSKRAEERDGFASRARKEGALVFREPAEFARFVGGPPVSCIPPTQPVDFLSAGGGELDHDRGGV